MSAPDIPGVLANTRMQTKHLQEALAACGWEEAANLEQQDTSEAFSFITEKLELPLLTLKMDIFHTGKEDHNDDHKFVQERLLEVAVPDDAERERPIRLEDCLESYFNNQVEVVRRLERSNTKTSVKSAKSPFFDKSSYEREWLEGASTHVEVSELPWSTPDTPTSSHAPGTPILPGVRDRAPSIIRHRIVYNDEKEDVHHLERVDTPTSIRKGSIRKEVLMPAWQFFNLIRPSPFFCHLRSFSRRTPPKSSILINEIAWYTQHSPSNDAEVAAHFSKTRPVLGICLKRYAMTEDGRAVRKNTFIDIPLDIRLPHFIQDEVISEDGPLVGNFKLSLQSVICHRGNSVHSGHYISFIRGHQVADGDAGSSRRLSNNTNPPVYAEDKWVRFDDLAPTRVQYVDIEKAMRDEMPYLLFYQVTPMHELHSLPEMDPPSYQDSGIGLTVSSPQSTEQSLKGTTEGYFDGANDPKVPATRSSSDADRTDEPRRSINLTDERRGSLAFTEVSMASTATIASAPGTPGEETVAQRMSRVAAPVTPGEETAAQRMSRAAARFTKSANKSRPSSQSGEGRLSLTLSRLNWRASKEQLFNKTDNTKEKDNVLANGSSITDGASETPESSAIDDSVLKTDDESTPTKVTKKDKKRNKSKGPAEVVDQDHHNQHTHHLRGKGKGKDKDKPKDIDRECTIM
jgi:hypothetical protein